MSAAYAQKNRGRGIKIRCENWYWSRKVQMLLHAEIGARWVIPSLPIPWNTKREFLIVERLSRGWRFMWATETDFEACPLPQWSAKALIAAHRSAGAQHGPHGTRTR